MSNLKPTDKTPQERLLDLLQGWNQYVEETGSAEAEADRIGELYQEAGQLPDAPDAVISFVVRRVVPVLVGAGK